MSTPPSLFRPATHRQVLVFLWRHLRVHRITLAVMLVLMLCKIALELIEPFFYRAAVDAVTGGDPSDEVAYSIAFKMFVIGAMFSVLSHTLFEYSNRLLAWVETRSMFHAHADVFAHVQRLSTGFHSNSFAGATSRKIGRGTDGIESMIDHLWFHFLPLILTIFGFIVVLFWHFPPIGFTVVVGVLVYIPCSIAMNLYHARFFSWVDRQDTRVTASLVDTLSGNAAVKAYGAERREDTRHCSVLKEWQGRCWTTWQLGQLIGWAHGMLIIALELSLFLMALWLWRKGSFGPGDFVLIIFYFGLLWGYMRDVGRQVREYMKALSHAEEMVGLRLTLPAVADTMNARKLTVHRGAIRFGDVSFGYEQGGRLVFDHFSTDIEAGEKVALVGQSGGGKSTLVKLLLRLYDVQGGAITIDGENIASVTQKSLRTAIGLIPQDPLLFHRSIAENISYGRPDASLEEIERVAKLAHAHEFIVSLHNGYDTLVGERGVKLSGGERQRIAIARAILADTPILVLDEATSSLDSHSEQCIQDALRVLMEGRTTIVIAHRLSTIKQVDRILVIEQGRIVEEGSHNALVRKNGGIYRGFYELQAGGFIGE